MIIKLGKKKDHREWHTWFAWYPIIYTGNSGNRTFIWLRKVERQKYPTYEGFAYDIRNLDGSEIP